MLSSCDLLTQPRPQHHPRSPLIQCKLNPLASPSFLLESRERGNSLSIYWGMHFMMKSKFRPSNPLSPTTTAIGKCHVPRLARPDPRIIQRGATSLVACPASSTFETTVTRQGKGRYNRHLGYMVVESHLQSHLQSQHVKNKNQFSVNLTSNEKTSRNLSKRIDLLR